jgi:hypothetical protein
LTIEINDKDVQEWLEECNTESTRNNYRYGIGIFFKWLQDAKGKTIQDYKDMDTKDRMHYALVFQKSKPMSEGRVYKSKRKRGFKTSDPKPLSNNAINSVLSALQSFTFHLNPDRPLPLKGKRIAIEEDMDSHDYSKEDLGKLYNFQDAKGKAIIAVASSCGLEVSSFLALDRQRVEKEIKILEEKTKADPNTPQYIFYDTIRGKTKVKGLCVLNPLAIESLKQWLPLNHSDNLFDMTRSGITKFMKSAARKANLTTTGRVRFHKIRSWVYTNLLRASFSSEEAKMIVHKAIPKSDSTYLKLKAGIQEKYPQVYDQFLNIRSTLNGSGIIKKDLAKTQSTVVELANEVQRLKAENERLRIDRTEMDKLKDQFEEVKKLFKEKELKRFEDLAKA